jgi:hypothetical protein
MLLELAASLLPAVGSPRAVQLIEILNSRRIPTERVARVFQDKSGILRLRDIIVSDLPVTNG